MSGRRRVRVIVVAWNFDGSAHPHRAIWINNCAIRVIYSPVWAGDGTVWVINSTIGAGDGAIGANDSSIMGSDGAIGAGDSLVLIIGGAVLSNGVWINHAVLVDIIVWIGGAVGAGDGAVWVIDNAIRAGDSPIGANNSSIRRGDGPIWAGDIPILTIGGAVSVHSRIILVCVFIRIDIASRRARCVRARWAINSPGHYR